jgi:hypothetical protein
MASSNELAVLILVVEKIRDLPLRGFVGQADFCCRLLVPPEW